MKSLAITAVLLLASTAIQAASDLDSLDELANQAAFDELARDVGGAVSYRALTPAEPLGILGFDVGVETTITSLESTDIFNTACGDCGDDSLTALNLHAHKGLPFNIDVGLMYGSISDSNIDLLGYELRWAMIEGGTLFPALALRLHASQISGVDQLDLDTFGYELAISKGFLMFTPYAGIGQVEVTATPQGSAVTTANQLTKAEESLDRLFLGVNVSLGLINIVVETDKTGDTSTTGLKLGVRF